MNPAPGSSFDGRNEIVSADLWIYQGDTTLGLPPRFNLLFFKKQDIGEYELYHPWSDGPDALVRRGELLRNRQHAAVDILEIVSMDLARASLVVDLTDPHADFLSATNTIAPRLDTVRPSMSVDKNLVDIEESPYRLVDLEEIEGYLRYGDRVTAEYSFRFVKSEADFRVLVGPRNTPFIHYSVKLAPEDFALEFDDRENVYQTTLDVELELRTLGGQLVAMQRNEPQIRLSESQHLDAGRSPFAYRDNLPVIPGEYEVSVVVRNRATQQYTVASSEVRVPATGAGSVGLADLVLAYRTELEPEFSGMRFGTFQFGSTVLEPSVGGVFAAGDVLSVAAQPVNASGEHEIRLRILRAAVADASPAPGEPLVERTVPAGSAGAPPIEDFRLSDLGAGPLPRDGGSAGRRRRGGRFPRGSARGLAASGRGSPRIHRPPFLRHPRAGVVGDGARRPVPHPRAGRGGHRGAPGGDGEPGAADGAVETGKRAAVLAEGRRGARSAAPDRGGLPERDRGGWRESVSPTTFGGSAAKRCRGSSTPSPCGRRTRRS